MVPFVSKAMFAMAAVSLLAAVVYGLATQDGSATVILGFAAAGAFVLGLAGAIADPDLAPPVAPDAPQIEQAPIGAPARPSPWPLAGAIALGVLALAAATTGVVVVAAALLLTITGLGWLFQAWSEHPNFTSTFAGRLRERFVLPIGLPLSVLFLIAVIAVSLSRVFLALPETGTRLVALLVAVLILGGAFAVAASERMARTALALLSSFALLAIVAAGLAGLSHGEHPFEKPKVVNVFQPEPGQPARAASSSSTVPSTTVAP